MFTKICDTFEDNCYFRGVRIEYQNREYDIVISTGDGPEEVAFDAISSEHADNNILRGDCAKAGISFRDVEKALLSL